MTETKKASEITECEECPLYGNDCKGGWTSEEAEAAFAQMKGE